MNDQPRETVDRQDQPPARTLQDLGIEDGDLRLEVFALCESAVEQGGRLSLLGTYEVVQTTGFPLVLPQVTVVLRVRFWPAESRGHALRLVLTGPDGAVVGAPVEVMARLQPVCGERSAAYNLIAQMHNLRIEEAGEHTFDFYLDGKIEGRLPLCVNPVVAQT